MWRGVAFGVLLDMATHTWHFNVAAPLSTDMQSCKASCYVTSLAMYECFCLRYEQLRYELEIYEAYDKIHLGVSQPFFDRHGRLRPIHQLKAQSQSVISMSSTLQTETLQTRRTTSRLYIALAQGTDIYTLTTMCRASEKIDVGRCKTITGFALLPCSDLSSVSCIYCISIALSLSLVLHFVASSSSLLSSSHTVNINWLKLTMSQHNKRQR